MLFDVTGTLLEVREPVGITYARLAAGRGIALDAERAGGAFVSALSEAPPLAFPRVPPSALAAAERAWWRRVVERVVRDAGGEDAPWGAALADFFEEVYHRYADPHAWRPLPGAAETLAGLAERGYRLGVLSNFDSRLEPLLAGTGLARWLQAIVTSSQAGAAKPAARAFETAVARLGARAQETAYVGDSPEVDARGARAAGLVPILLAREGSAGLDAPRIERLPELLQLLPGVDDRQGAARAPAREARER